MLSEELRKDLDKFMVEASIPVAYILDHKEMIEGLPKAKAIKPEYLPIGRHLVVMVREGEGHISYLYERVGTQGFTMFVPTPYGDLILQYEYDENLNQGPEGFGWMAGCRVPEGFSQEMLTQMVPMIPIEMNMIGVMKSKGRVETIRR